MSGPSYISNPALWEQLRHTREGENFIPSVGRKIQRGGGILNQRKAYMILVKPQHSKAEIKQITPVATEQERALSNLKEAMRNEEPHMPLKKKENKKKEIDQESQSLDNRQTERTRAEGEEKNETTFRQTTENSEIETQIC